MAVGNWGKFVLIEQPCSLLLTCLFQLVNKLSQHWCDSKKHCYHGWTTLLTLRCSSRPAQRCSFWPAQPCSCMLASSTLFIHAGQHNLVHAGHLNLVHAGSTSFMLASSTLFMLASSTLFMLASSTLFMLASSTLFMLTSSTSFMLASSRLFILASSTLFMLASSTSFSAGHLNLVHAGQHEQRCSSHITMLCVFICLYIQGYSTNPWMVWIIHYKTSLKNGEQISNLYRREISKLFLIGTITEVSEYFVKISTFSCVSGQINQSITASFNARRYLRGCFCNKLTYSTSSRRRV